MIFWPCQFGLVTDFSQITFYMQGQQPIVPTQKVPFWAIHNALRETALTRPELKAKQSEILFLIEGLTVYSFPQTRSLIKDLFGPFVFIIYFQF